MSLLNQIIIQTSVSTIIIFGGYFTASYFLINSNHGRIGAWLDELSKLYVKIRRVNVFKTDDDQFLNIKAPLDEDERLLFKSFVNHHDVVIKTEKRLSVIRRRFHFFIISLLFGLAIGVTLSISSLFGEESLASQFPLLPGMLSAVSSIAFIAFLSWPQAVAWNDLQDAVRNNGK